jgi:hypothetical protein
MALFAAKTDTNASSGYYHYTWDTNYVVTESWGDHSAASYGGNATFWGTNLTFGRDWYYDHNTNLSVIYSQLGITSGYSDCGFDGNFHQRFYNSQQVYWWQVPNSQINTWATNVSGSQSYPITWNPFSSCNSAYWHVYDYSTFVDQTPTYVYDSPQTFQGGYIVCIVLGGSCDAGEY